jgi:hypothetical protein
MPCPVNGLCSRCKVLSLDDQALNGRKAVIKRKAAYLKLPLEHPEQEGQGNIPLEYRLEDQFPRFPLLTAAALSGCRFCRLLKDAICDFVPFQGSPVVAISLAYRWSYNKAGNLGLTGLFAYVEVRHGQSSILRFLVDGNGGARRHGDWGYNYLSSSQPFCYHLLRG